MNICIFGAGPGAMAMACRAMDAGHRVGLCELARFKSNLDGFDRTLSIQSEGLLTGRFNIAFATTDPQKGLEWSDVIIVVTHAGAHQEIAEFCARFLSRPKPVILCPAYVGGGWCFERQLRTAASIDRNAVVECSVLPFACRKSAGDTVSIHGIKRRFMLSAIGRIDHTETAVGLMQELFDGVEKSPHPIEAGLNETNFILHPCIALLNMGYVQGPHPWTFYRQGLTERIGALVEAVDAERQRLARHLGLLPIPLTRWMSDFYGDQGLRGDSIYEMMYTFPPFAQSPGPRSLAHRYFNEDIAYGLVPMSSLARLCGLPVPLTDALIDLGSLLCGTDFRKIGRDLNDFGGFELETTTHKSRRRK